MKIIEWNDLPENMRNEQVREYYKLLKKKEKQLILKRLFDIVLSFCLLILLLPVFFIIAICIKLDFSGPILFRQVRITSYGKKFMILKFRTMREDGKMGNSLVTVKNDSRITSVGRVLRKYRLDELPQLVNIILGDMSFVGTRPEVVKYVKGYTNEMHATLLMPAGVTSLASLKFKDEDELIDVYLKDDVSVEKVYEEVILPKKMEWNLNYIKNFSILKDFHICLMTIVGVFR